jgi:hypothetical protein
MAVLRIIPAGDLAVDSGRLLFFEDLDHIRQTIACRLRFGRGEWFLDLREGVPYYQVVLVKNPDFSVIRALFRRVILTVSGVLSVPVLTLELDRASRTLSVSFQAVCRSGIVKVVAGDPAFVLPVAA